MCFEINGLKTLKLTILRFFTQPPLHPPTYIYYLNSNKPFIIYKFTWIHIIFILMFWNVFFKGAIYLEFIVAD